MRCDYEDDDTGRRCPHEATATDTHGNWCDWHAMGHGNHGLLRKSHKGFRWLTQAEINAGRVLSRLELIENSG